MRDALTKFEQAFVDHYPESFRAIVANKFYVEATYDEWGGLQTWKYKDWSTGRIYLHTELAELGRRYENLKKFKFDFNEFLK